MIPKISVIVPVYNVENYVKKCVESIISQTYQNIEIILDRLSLKFGDIRTALRSDLKKGINAA